jgi:DUF4097 and DUF4098 domain-containing protein YvlB
MIATGGRVTAVAVGIPLALGVMGWQAFSMVGYMAQTSEHHEASYPWNGGEISIDVTSGSVHVVVGDSDTVGVSYTEHYQLKEPTVSATASDTGVQIKAHCPGALFSNNCEINYVLTVPSSAKMTIHSGNGGVHVSDVTGALNLDTGDGGIVLDDVSGDVQAHTGDGGVHGSALRSKSLQAHTGDGGIDLEWESAPTTVAITSGDGGVHVTVPQGSGPYRVDASSGDGGRDVSVPTDPNAAASITVHTGDGGISVGYP